MVHLCAIENCSNRSNREKEKSYFRIPKVIENQGEIVKNVSMRRRRKWLDNINRDDINENKTENYRVCSDHFVSGNILFFILFFPIHYFVDRA